MPRVAGKFTQPAQGRLLWPGHDELRDKAEPIAELSDGRRLLGMALRQREDFDAIGGHAD